MLSKSTQKRIKEHKWSSHSNQSQFFKRVQIQSSAALKDLTLIAEHLDPAQLKEIFTQKDLDPLIKALMRPDLTRSGYKGSKEESDRIFFLGYMFLHWSLNITRAHIDNPWAQRLFSEHEAPLNEIIRVLYHERLRTPGYG